MTSAEANRVTRRLTALLNPSGGAFDWRTEIRACLAHVPTGAPHSKAESRCVRARCAGQSQHREKVVAYALSFAQQLYRLEQISDARLLLDAFNKCAHLYRYTSYHHPQALARRIDGLPARHRARREAGLPDDPRALELLAQVSRKPEAPAAGQRNRVSLGAATEMPRRTSELFNTPDVRGMQTPALTPAPRGSRATPPTPSSGATPTSAQQQRASGGLGGGSAPRDTGARPSPGSGARLLRSAQQSRSRGACARLSTDSMAGGAAAAAADDEAQSLNVAWRGDERLAYDIGRLSLVTPATAARAYARVAAETPAAAAANTAAAPSVDPASSAAAVAAARRASDEVCAQMRTLREQGDKLVALRRAALAKAQKSTTAGGGGALGSNEWAYQHVLHELVSVSADDEPQLPKEAPVDALWALRLRVASAGGGIGVGGGFGAAGGGGGADGGGEVTLLVRLFSEAAPRGVDALKSALSQPDSLLGARCTHVDAARLQLSLPRLTGSAAKTALQREKDRLPPLEGDDATWLVYVRLGETAAAAAAATSKIPVGTLEFRRGAGAGAGADSGSVVGRVVHVRSSGLPKLQELFGLPKLANLSLATASTPSAISIVGWSPAVPAAAGAGALPTGS